MGITKQQNSLECGERARGGERPNDNKTQPTTFRILLCCHRHRRTILYKHTRSRGVESSDY